MLDMNTELLFGFIEVINKKLSSCMIESPSKHSARCTVTPSLPGRECLRSKAFQQEGFSAARLKSMICYWTEMLSVRHCSRQPLSLAVARIQ
jgi:hypothetical protein